MNLKDLKEGNTNEQIQMEVTPEDLGFKPAENNEESIPMDDDKALKEFEENIIPRKAMEMRMFNDIMEETNGNISKQELNEAMGMGYVNELLGKDPIPLNTEPMKKVEEARKRKLEIVEEEEVPEEKDELSKIMDDVNENDMEDDELEETESDVFSTPTNGIIPQDNTKITNVPEVDPKKILEYKPKEDEYNLPTNLSELEFPDDEEEDDDDISTQKTEDNDEEEVSNKLKMAIKSKLSPVANKFDLSAFTITKNPIALNSVLDTIESPNLKAADWVSYNSGYKFRMLGFTGPEFDKLNNPGGSKLQSETIRYKMLYDHIIDKDKPATMEQWAKVTSFFDVEHYWFGAFRSSFEGCAYVPISYCPTDNKHVFLTDNIEIMDFVKFKNDDAKERFRKIYNKELAESKSLYKSELVPVSDSFAMAFREPSIYNMVFEIATLDDQFISKYRDIITLVMYIDEIYFVNKKTMNLSPVNYKVYPNNTQKTLKSKIIQYAKAIRTLSSDQYNSLLIYIKEIGEKDDNIVYKIPELTCEECGAKIDERELAASELVFTRHQLAALALM